MEYVLIQHMKIHLSNNYSSLVNIYIFLHHMHSKVKNLSKKSLNIKPTPTVLKRIALKSTL